MFHIKSCNAISKMERVLTDSANRESLVHIKILVHHHRQMTIHNQFLSDLCWCYCIAAFYKSGSLLKSAVFCMNTLVSKIYQTPT